MYACTSRERFHLTRSRETAFFRHQQKHTAPTRGGGGRRYCRTSAYCARNYSMQIALFPPHRITTDCNVFRRGIYAALPNNTWLNTLLRGVGRDNKRLGEGGWACNQLSLVFEPRVIRGVPWMRRRDCCTDKKTIDKRSRATVKWIMQARIDCVNAIYFERLISTLFISNVSPNDIAKRFYVRGSRIMGWNKGKCKFMTDDRWNCAILC